MTIEELGNLGDLIAGIATVATLVYIAIQIRQNSRSIEGATYQSRLNLEMSNLTLAAQHVNVYRRGCENLSDLTDDEKVLFEILVRADVSSYANAFVQYQRGLTSDIDHLRFEWEKRFLPLSGFQSVWSEIRCCYPKDFCDWLDGARKKK